MGERAESVKGGAPVPNASVQAGPTHGPSILDDNRKTPQAAEANAAEPANADLVALALADDPEAFRILVERYQAPVTALAYAMVGERDMARDVAQEAFSESYRLLESLREPQKYGSWVCGIARRRSIYHLRRRKRSRLVTSGSLQDRKVDPAGTPADHLERSEVRKQVLDALETLSEKYRVVLILKYVEGMSYERIAQVLDVRVATVDKRLTRAKAMLRNVLKDL